jgi:hypothetical protein
MHAASPKPWQPGCTHLPLAIRPDELALILFLLPIASRDTLCFGINASLYDHSQDVLFGSFGKGKQPRRPVTYSMQYGI